jgi:phosphoglycolate phosphatase
MHVILFDIDGTLISTGGAGKAALEAVLASEFGIGNLIERLSLSGRTDRAIISDLFDLYGIDESPDNWQRLREGYLRHLPACLGRVRGQVLPGVVELLEMLRGRPHTAVGLLTGNLRAGARAKLEHYGLLHHFAFGGYGDDHLDRDDVAREAWAEVRRQFNGTVPAERVWVVGDTPLDVRCARAIGAKAVAVATGWHSHDELARAQPDLLLGDLSDPSPLLGHWDG